MKKTQWLSTVLLLVLSAGCVQQRTRQHEKLWLASGTQRATADAARNDVQPELVQQVSFQKLQEGSVATAAGNSSVVVPAPGLTALLAAEGAGITPEDTSPSDIVTTSERAHIGLPVSTSSEAIPPHSIGTEPAGYSLADLEQIALSNNPTLVVAAATVSRANGLWQQVGVRPNPTVGYFGQQIADRGTAQHGLFFEQEFVRGDKLAFNRAVHQHNVSAQRWELESLRHRILTDVRVRFYEALAAQRQLEVSLSFAELAERGVQVANDRKKAGEGTTIEVLQAQTLLSEVNLSAEQSDAEYRGAWKDLASIAGLPSLEPVSLLADFGEQPATPSWNAVYASIVAQSPELRVANELVCEKRALLSRQQVQMIPNVTTQVGAGYDDGTNSGMINVQVSAPLPVNNLNSGNICAAQAAYTQALENVKRIEAAIQSRLSRAAQEFESAQVATTKYREEIIPQTQESLDLSEEAYRAGELDFLQVLIVRRSYYEASLRYIAAQGRLAQAQASIDGLLLTGGLDAPADYTTDDGLRGQSFGGQ